MAQNQFPFFDPDFGKFAEFGKFMDPNKFAEFGKFMDPNKMADMFKMPAFDAKAMADSQRKTVEAITTVNRVAYEGGQAIAQRQTEIVREAVDEAMKAMKELASATPEDRFAKQTELAKESYEATLANIRELTEMASKANQEALDVINARVTEVLDEMRSAAKVQTAKKK